MRTHKYSMLILLLLFLTGCSVNEKPTPIDASDKQLVQKGKYLYYRNEKVTGSINQYYSDRKIKSRASYDKGLLNGPFKSWYENGQQESQRFYEDGEKVGSHLGWWENGKPKFEYHFSQGQYNGAFKEWYENGKPLHVFEYNHGAEVSAVGWRENGKTYINFIVRNGRKYGLTNSRLCFSLKDEQGLYQKSSTN